MLIDNTAITYNDATRCCVRDRNFVQKMQRRKNNTFPNMYIAYCLRICCTCASLVLLASNTVVVYGIQIIL